MRILIQRVRRASVSVRNELVSRIGAGMLILVGIADEDTVEDIEWLGEATALPLYRIFTERLAELLGRPVATGVFGADMQVELINDGPVTIWMDSRNRE